MKSQSAVVNSISPDASIGKGVQVWNYAQVRENASIGDETTIGSFAYIDSNVKIGKNCKIQNRAMIYDCAVLHDGVFIGPGVILTNDKNPRAVSVIGQIKANTDWEKSGVEILEGASIGAGSICIAPVRIGKWASIGAGSVVTKDVKNYALVVGNPARQIAWVGPSGVRLALLSEGIYQCPRTLTKFEEINEELHEIISE